MARPYKYSDKEIITALRETKGMVYLAAARVGCEADTIYNRAKKCPAVAKAIKAERGKVVDTAELALFKAILNEEPWAIQFALRLLGQDRGYIERHEHTGKDGGPMEQIHHKGIDWDQLARAARADDPIEAEIVQVEQTALPEHTGESQP